MGVAPVIGIACAVVHAQWGPWQQQAAVVAADYIRQVQHAGGVAVVLPPHPGGPDELLDVIDGLMLTGGNDLGSSLYGADPHPEAEDADHERDRFEAALVRRAIERDIPFLGICRGIQVLNVARGGALVQEIADEVAGHIDHMVREPRFAIAHDIWLTSGSLLERLMRERIAEGEDCPVNSRHHQAARAAGDGLVVTATAPDGVIEALEDPARRFCLGVQWHPENFWRTGEFRPLFEGFVKAATR